MPQDRRRINDPKWSLGCFFLLKYSLGEASRSRIKKPSSREDCVHFCGIAWAPATLERCKGTPEVSWGCSLSETNSLHPQPRSEPRERPTVLWSVSFDLSQLGQTLSFNFYPPNVQTVRGASTKAWLLQPQSDAAGSAGVTALGSSWILWRTTSRYLVRSFMPLKCKHRSPWRAVCRARNS